METSKAVKTNSDPTVAVLIWRHYEKIGIKKGWTRERFNRLCKLANLLPEELGALCAVQMGQIRTMMKNDKFPPTVSLHLAIIEGVVIEAQCGKEFAPVMPMNLLKKS